MFRQIHFRVFWIGCFLSMFLLLSAQSKLDSLHHLHEVVITAQSETLGDCVKILIFAS